jgi:hypothetical protein
MEMHADKKHEKVNREKIVQRAVPGIEAQDKEQTSTPE